MRPRRHGGGCAGRPRCWSTARTRSRNPARPRSWRAACTGPARAAWTARRRSRRGASCWSGPVRSARRDGRRARRPGRLDRAGNGRVAPEAGELRAVHQQVLLAFADSGHPPARPGLERAAASYGRTAAAVLADLHAGDFIQLDGAGEIRAAYPFSAVPTPHVVRIDGGPRVYAMCAIDALGMAAMLGREVTVVSTDTRTGQPNMVTVAK